MIIRIHCTDPDGRPVECTGDWFAGRTALEIVEGMMLHPFTKETATVPYMVRVLASIGLAEPELPSDPAEAATAFLERLVASGFAAWETEANFEKFGGKPEVCPIPEKE